MIYREDGTPLTTSEVWCTTGSMHPALDAMRSALRPDLRTQWERDRDDGQWVDVLTFGSTVVTRVQVRTAKAQWRLDYEDALRHLGVPEQRW